MEDDLNILKVEYLNNHWSDCNHWADFPQILKLSLEDQTKIKNASNEDDLQWKTTSKYQNLNIPANTDWNLLQFLI